MTPERAAYHRLMLLAGLSEDYERELDHVLETADPIPEPELSLALCISDLNETLSVLCHYTLEHPADDRQVYDMILASLRGLYTQKRFSAAQLCDIMYRIAHASDDAYACPWDELRYPSYAYDDVADGYISEETFRTLFEAFLHHGKWRETWQLPGATKKKRSIWDLFRKHKRKENTP